MDKDRPLFLAGAAGFIGSAFVRLALESGYRVIAFDLLTYAGHRCNIEDVLDPGRCELIVGDICDGARVVELLETHQPAAVVNFAAESHVDRSIADSDPFISTNVVGTAQLLKASLDYMGKLPDSRAEDFRFVQISTDEVFGALPDAGRFSETTPYDPRSPYAASKASADHLVRAFGHTYGLPVIITHCGNNYGPRQYPEKLIPLSIMNALGGRPT
jgi:dTDP-glucose 4,6-dehydratase